MSYIIFGKTRTSGIVIIDDIAKTIGIIIESFDINNDLIVLNIIKQVGIGDTFINKKQTRIFWTSEYYIPKVFDKKYYWEWINTGKKTVIERAKEIWATHNRIH